MNKPVALNLWLARLGFDVPRLGFGLRTALASCLALLLAWLMGLEHPQWAAMTVWAVSQPVRGMLVEKSLFRALGTVVGTLFGVLLVVVAGDNLPLMVISLSLWIGLCVGIGNLLSGLISYGALLSGYSATMVALLNTQQPADQIFLLGSDRLLTVMTGVVVGLLIGLLFTPRNAEDHLAARVRRTSSDILRAMAALFAGRMRESRADIAHRLLETIASTEQLFDANAAGSLRSTAVSARCALVRAQVARPHRSTVRAIWTATQPWPRHWIELLSLPDKRPRQRVTACTGNRAGPLHRRAIRRCAASTGRSVSTWTQRATTAADRYPQPRGTAPRPVGAPGRTPRLRPAAADWRCRVTTGWWIALMVSAPGDDHPVLHLRNPGEDHGAHLHLTIHRRWRLWAVTGCCGRWRPASSS